MAENIEIPCDTRITIAAVESYFEKFETALNSGSSVTLQADEVEQVDTAFLQMICTFKTSLNDLGLALSWQSPSDALMLAATNLGLQQATGLDQLQ